MQASNRAKMSAPRRTLLENASRLFYAEGITAVGVDRILQESGVSRTTMYRHFTGKEALVIAYLQREDDLTRAAFSEALSRAVSPDHRLELAIEGIVDDAYRYHTSGCPFIKAADEHPDPDSPVRQVIREHRAWFHGELRAMLTDAGRDDVDAKVEALAMLRDGLLTVAYLDDKEAARRTFVRMARSVTGLP